MDLEDESTRRALVVGGGTVLLGGAVAIGASTLGEDEDGSEGGESGPAVHAAEGTTGFGVDLSDNPVLGSLDAPIDLYYWTDYRSPACRRFERRTLPKIVEERVAPGTVRVIFLQYPRHGEESWSASVVAKCVWRSVAGRRPGAFWEWHSSAMARGDAVANRAARERLVDVARGVDGVDAAAVATCADGNARGVAAAIQSEIRRAETYGVDGVPGFVTYDRDAGVAGRIVGAKPYAAFASAIERLLRD